MGQIGAAVLSGPGEPGAAGGNRHPQTLGDLLVGQPFLVEQEQNFPVPGGELDRQHLGQTQGRRRRRCQTGRGGMEGLFLGGLLGLPGKLVAQLIVQGAQQPAQGIFVGLQSGDLLGRGQENAVEEVLGPVGVLEPVTGDSV